MRSAVSPPTLVDPIVAFLRRVGIDAIEGSVPRDSFLPGVHIAAGQLRFDSSRLRWPGDLLHEAGHIAVTPAARRPFLNDALSGREAASQEGEVEAIAWSYAAVLTIGLDPVVIFHAAGYRGRSEDLLRTYSLGVYPGVGGLEAIGMALGAAAAGKRGVPAYPSMLYWLRP